MTRSTRHRMKSNRSILRLAGLAALGILLGLTPVRAGVTVPFRSAGEIRLTQVTPVSADPLCLVLEGTDNGRGTLLGRYTSIYQVKAWLDTSPDGPWRWVFEGTFVTTTARGDTLTVNLQAEGPTPDGSWPSEVLGLATVQEGTGRLAGVQGSWISRALPTPTGFVYRSTGELTLPGKRPAK